jgi:hypothetical protein
MLIHQLNPGIKDLQDLRSADGCRETTDLPGCCLTSGENLRKAIQHPRDSISLIILSGGCHSGRPFHHRHAPVESRHQDLNQLGRASSQPHLVHTTNPGAENVLPPLSAGGCQKPPTKVAAITGNSQGSSGGHQPDEGALPLGNSSS